MPVPKPQVRCENGRYGTATNVHHPRRLRPGARFTHNEGHEQAFDELMTHTGGEIRRHEPGTLAYVVHHVEGEPRTRIFYELCADLAAFEHHETAPHMLRFAAERARHLDKVQVDRLAVFTHAGASAATPA